MEVKLTYYGHSTFMLSNGEISIVFDPFFNGNTWEKATATATITAMRTLLAKPMMPS